MIFAAVYKSQVIILQFYGPLETIQYIREEIMSQTALGFVHKQDSYVVGAISLEGFGC